MTKINVGKVVMGGLLAGAVTNLIDLLTNAFWLKSNWVSMLQARNLDPATMDRMDVMVRYVLIDFLFGVVAVWVYAAMRPRFGPGPRTAAIAAIALWIVSSAVVGQFQILGMFTPSFYVQGCLAALCSTVPGTIAGAWVYSE